MLNPTFFSGTLAHLGHFFLQLPDDACMCGVEKSCAAAVQLDYQTFFRVYTDTVADKFSAVENNRYSVT
jgi:hypothetical protein